jgi:hypothetical protein
MDQRTTGCRRCLVCEGYTHHWIEDCEETEDLPAYSHVCTHCDAVGLWCAVCGGEGCDACTHEGVVCVTMMPPCVWCERRIPTPQHAIVCEEAPGMSSTALYCSTECCLAHARALGRLRVSMRRNTP